jgi:predicted glycosyltransferase involved in capsule biosynthesis
MEESVERFSMQRFVKDWKVFCPVGFRDWREFLSADAPELSSETFAVHLWHEMWRAAGQNKNTHYHPASLYEQLRRRYLGDSDRVSLQTVERILGRLTT